MLVLALLVLAAAVYFLASGLTVAQRDVAVSLGRARRYGARNQREIDTSKNVNERLVGPLVARVTAVAVRLTPASRQAQIRRRLHVAGLARAIAPQTFLALKFGVPGAAVLVGLALLVVGAPPMLALAFLGGGGAIGYIAPEFVLNHRIRARKDAIQLDLPNVLDLLCVSVEAGLGFDQAVAKLSERMTGPLVEEFALVLHEMRIGQTRAGALKNLAERLDIAEVSQFTRALIQADQLGIALARILRVQSADMRVRRQLAAEERAMKAPVKMLFPTVVFIFPAMFVVVLGPAMLGFMTLFSAK